MLACSGWSSTPLRRPDWWYLAILEMILSCSAVAVARRVFAVTASCIDLGGGHSPLYTVLSLFWPIEVSSIWECSIIVHKLWLHYIGIRILKSLVIFSAIHRHGLPSLIKSNSKWSLLSLKSLGFIDLKSPSMWTSPFTIGQSGILFDFKSK